MQDAPPDCKVFKANRDRWMDPRSSRLACLATPRLLASLRFAWQLQEEDRPRNFEAVFMMPVCKRWRADGLSRPTPWECHEMRGLIEERAGKKELTKEDVAALAKDHAVPYYGLTAPAAASAEDLGQSGIEEVGRFLKSPAAVFEEVMEQD